MDASTALVLCVPLVWVVTIFFFFIYYYISNIGLSYCDSCVSQGIEQNVPTVTVHRQHAFTDWAETQTTPPATVTTASKTLHWICCTKCSGSSGLMFLRLCVLVQSVVCLPVPEASSSDRCCSGGNSCCSTELRPFAPVVGQGCMQSV